MTDVLFPFARRGVEAFIARHLEASEIRELVQQLQRDWARDVEQGQRPPAWFDTDTDQRIASVVSYVGWLMERDRKSTALKDLQGRIWQQGYAEGMLHGEVFPDVPPALARWEARRLPVAIFSSGSVLAQQLLFRTTAFGDLTPALVAFFDTTTGPKTSPESYRQIAAVLACAPTSLLFISDTPAELDAASAAGCDVRLCVRSTTSPAAATNVRRIHSFDDLP